MTACQRESDANRRRHPAPPHSAIWRRRTAWEIGCDRHGRGSRQLPGVPDVLRVLGFAAAERAGDTVLVIEFDIDDQSPEELATGLDRLRRVPGVRDVATFLGIGKKGRWLQAVRVMANPAHRDAVVGAVFGEREHSVCGCDARRERCWRAGPSSSSRPVPSA